MACSAEGIKMVVLVTAFLFFGSYNTISAKLQFQTCAPTTDPSALLADGHDGCPAGQRKFDKPWLSNMYMSMGMASLMLVYVATSGHRRTRQLQKANADRTSDSPEQGSSDSALSPVPFYIFAVPAMCDVFGTGLAAVGMLHMDASVWQMLRSSIIIFSAILSVCFLKRKLQPCHWLAIAIVSVGLVLVGLSSILDSKGSDTSAGVDLEMMGGIALVIGAQLIQAFQMVFEEMLLTGRYKVSAKKVVGMEGLWGMLFMGMILLFLSAWPGHDDGCLESTPQGLYMVAHSPMLIVLVLTFMLSIAFYNITGMTIGKKMSTMVRCLVDSCRTCVIWAVDLSIYYLVSEDYGSAWGPHSWLTLVGFGLLVLGTLLYNEVLPVPKWLRSTAPVVCRLASTGSMDNILAMVDLTVEGDSEVGGPTEAARGRPSQKREAHTAGDSSPMDSVPCTCWNFLAFDPRVRQEGELTEHAASARTSVRVMLQSSDAPEPKKATPPEAAIVVDPYSSGKYLLIELEKRGIPIICVRSSTKLSQQFLRSHVANSRFWAEMLEFEDFAGIPELVEALKALPYSIVGVFGGSEPGVELADHIANALAMPTANSLELLEARKDKAEMQEALRRNGVPAAEQFKSGNLEELLAWAERRNEWPLVAKPAGGAGSDGVYFCKSLEDLRFAHSNIIGVYNPTGKLNSEIALQEYLEGDEYIVDTVSYEGKHMLVAMWVYTKRKGLPWDNKAIVTMQTMLLAPTGEKQDQLVAYVFRVLDAVGLRYGPCHTEVMFTKQGPILVEVNARLHGLQGPRLIELTTGISKATYAADVILDKGDLFHKLYQEGRPGRYLYPRLRQCVLLVLISGNQGYLKTDLKEALSSLRLPSVLEIVPAVGRGGFINRSRDLATTAGSVLMVHESMEQIKADTAKIRELEESGKLYEVSEEPLPSSKPVAPAGSVGAPLPKKGEEEGGSCCGGVERADSCSVELARSDGAEPAESGDFESSTFSVQD